MRMPGINTMPPWLMQVWHACADVLVTIAGLSMVLDVNLVENCVLFFFCFFAKPCWYLMVPTEYYSSFGLQPYLFWDSTLLWFVQRLVIYKWNKIKIISKLCFPHRLHCKSTIYRNYWLISQLTLFQVFFKTYSTNIVN